jgi:DNA-binding NarL/FixJ family response regulator
MTTRTERRKVYQRVQEAVKRGELVKDRCADCGSKNVHAHHPNGYDQPSDLDVIWLCPAHHKLRHMPMVELTERQREIATLVSEGLTEQEIADRLFLSRLTVRNHKQTIYRKLGVNNAVQMTRVLTDAA